MRVTDDYIRHANWESLDSSRESGNWGSSGCRSLDGVTTHPEIPLPNNISMAHQETPRRLYTSGMRLSPSPIKERLFPPSPSTSSGGSNLHSEVLHNMKRRIYVRRHSRTLDEELGQSLHGYQCDSEPDLNEVAPQQSDTRDLASHGSSPSRRSIVPRDRANWTEPLHQRDQSETTIIHWTPKDQYSPCGDQNSSPRGRSRVVIQFPRTSDITIPKREARSKIPIKSENIRHRDKLHDAIHVPVSPSKKIEVLSSILGERTNSENLRSIQDAHKFHIAGTKLPIATNRSEFSPMKWLRTPTIDTQEQKWNSEPGRNVGKNIQSTQTASTATQGRNRFISSIFEPSKFQSINIINQ